MGLIEEGGFFGLLIDRGNGLVSSFLKEPLSGMDSGMFFGKGRQVATPDSCNI